MFDEDIKIAKPKTINNDAKTNISTEEYKRESGKGNTHRATECGEKIARLLSQNINSFPVEHDNEMMAIERGILLSFAVNVQLEQSDLSSVVIQSAKSGFTSCLQQTESDLYERIVDSSAYSFYYLAYRRGTEIERRIGQTFAMLCGHDGDPVYQELGEAIYCWFLSVVRKEIAKAMICS